MGIRFGTRPNNSRPKTRTNKLQFSQRVTLVSALFSMGIVLAALTANFALLWADKQPMTEETVTTISVYGAITSTITFGGYCALTAVRNVSENHAKREYERMG